MSAPETHTFQALSALVQLGASDTLLGLAVRELVAGTPAQPRSAVVGIELPTGAPVRPSAAGTAAPAPSPASAPAAATGGAAAAAATSFPPPGAATAPAVSIHPAKRKTEIVNFKTADGARSSVGFSPKDWDALVAAFEGEAEAVKTLVRSTAPKAPPDANRSKWTYQELMHLSQG